MERQLPQQYQMDRIISQQQRILGLKIISSMVSVQEHKLVQFICSLILGTWDLLSPQLYLHYSVHSQIIGTTKQTVSTSLLQKKPLPQLLSISHQLLHKPQQHPLLKYMTPIWLIGIFLKK